MGFRQWITNLALKYASPQPLIYRMYSQQTRGVYTKRNFAQYFDDAYRRNVVAYQAINRVARSAAGIPWKLQVDGKDMESQEQHPLFKLLARPNQTQGGAAFRESVVGYLMLTGNTYIEAVGAGDLGGKEPVELWSLRADRMRVVPSEKGVAGFVYEVNGALKDWKADPVTGSSPILHTKFFNPLDDWYGMSPVEAAAYSVDQHNEAGKWNQSLLQNSCRPSGALVYNNQAGGVLTEKQFERLKEQLNAAYAGEGNAGRAMILEGNLDWKQIAMTPAEMDWIEGKHVSAREISLAFGVPPQMLGIPGDSTYSNYQEARQSFYEDTVIPLNNFLLDDFNNWMREAYDGVTVVQDVRDIPALAPKREKIWSMVSAATFLSTNEKREAVGLPKVDGEEADKVLIPSGQITLDDMGQQPDGNEEPMLEEEEVEPGKKKPVEKKYVWEV